jgi:hypothetical protein
LCIFFLPDLPATLRTLKTVFLFLLPGFGELKKLSLILVNLEMKFLGFFSGEFNLYGVFFTFEFNVGGTATAAAAADCRL